MCPAHRRVSSENPVLQGWVDGGGGIELVWVGVGEGVGAQFSQDYYHNLTPFPQIFFSHFRDATTRQHNNGCHKPVSGVKPTLTVTQLSRAALSWRPLFELQNDALKRQWTPEDCVGVVTSRPCPPSTRWCRDRTRLSVPIANTLHRMRFNSTAVSL
ncbi:hypothetical protein J6590_002853 [Homalodisca vitripennis]|nr:hypothetical protein J6590_002853 [Homalodisca vitripennis]